MATLSTKVSTGVADAFERLADESGLTTSAALRELVEMAVGGRRLELVDAEDEHAGWLFVNKDDDDG